MKVGGYCYKALIRISQCEQWAFPSQLEVLLVLLIINGCGCGKRLQNDFNGRTHFRCCKERRRVIGLVLDVVVLEKVLGSIEPDDGQFQEVKR